MGYSSIIDIIGSVMVGGFLLLLLLRLNSAATQNSYNYSEELILQQNLTSVAQIIEHDFRKIGYCENIDSLVAPTESIILADSIRIRFKTDENNDGSVDSIEYKLGGYNTATPNPEDRYLYRIVNANDTTNLNLGITNFRLLYTNEDSDTLSCPVLNPGEITSMEINLSVEKTLSYGDQFKNNEYEKYSGAFWRQIKLVARNLKKR